MSQTYILKTVKAGDTLFKIAESFYGDGNLWEKIATANGKISPKDLQAGQLIRFPAQQLSGNWVDTHAKKTTKPSIHRTNSCLQLKLLR
jgi:5'-nucleotidase